MAKSILSPLPPLSLAETLVLTVSFISKASLNCAYRLPWRREQGPPFLLFHPPPLLSLTLAQSHAPPLITEQRRASSIVSSSPPPPPPLSLFSRASLYILLPCGRGALSHVEVHSARSCNVVLARLVSESAPRSANWSSPTHFSFTPDEVSLWDQQSR